MDRDTLSPAQSPRKSDSGETRAAAECRSTPAVATTDFSRRPFGRCGLLPPRQFSTVSKAPDAHR